MGKGIWFLFIELILRRMSARRSQSKMYREMPLIFFGKSYGKCAQPHGFDRVCRASTELGCGVKFDLIGARAFVGRAI